MVDTAEKISMKETDLARFILEDLRKSFSNIEELIKSAENLKPAAFAVGQTFDLEMRTIQSLQRDLDEKLDGIDTLLRKKEVEFRGLVHRSRRFQRQIETLVKTSEVLNVLRNCKANCTHRNALKMLSVDYGLQTGEGFANQDLHFLICHDSNYMGSDGKKPLQAHKDVIDEWGFSWLGKFVKGRGDDGQYFQIESFGESMSSTPETFPAKTVQEKVRERVKNGRQVYLYLYDPNPPNIQLHVCNVLDFWFGEETIPNGEEFKELYPQCAHFPRYYFQKREKMCRTCTKVESTRCTPQFLSNFWFKIDKIEEVENFNLEFANLKNANTLTPINFAVPILYPLLVLRSENAGDPLM